MALSTDHTDLGYLVGRLLACAYPDSMADIPQNLWHLAHSHPSQALGQLGPALAEAANQTHIHEIMDMIPATVPAAPEPRKIENQGGVAIGYYHQRAALRRAKAMTGDLLREIGEALYGDRWQSDMRDALALGDATRIRDWLSGRRPIPAGIVTDLLILAHKRAGAAAQAAQKIEKLITQ